MKIINILLLSNIIIAVLLVSCDDKQCDLEIPKNLIKLSPSEIIERARVRNFPNLSEITYINECGVIIGRDSLVKTMNLDSLAFDDYADEDGIVRLTLYRPITPEDKQTQEEANLAYEEGPNISPVIVECDSVHIVLDEVLLRDQNNRKSYEDYSGENDFLNLAIVAGIFDNCDVSNISAMSIEDYTTIWLVIQHAPLKYQEKYLNNFKQLAENGKINKRDVYMMEDRILVSQGKPQIYGTQVGKNKSTGEFELYKVLDSLNLDKRRQVAGFEPINEYLLNWNIEY